MTCAVVRIGARDSNHVWTWRDLTWSGCRVLHDSMQVSAHFGFKDECKAKYGLTVYYRFLLAFQVSSKPICNWSLAKSATPDTYPGIRLKCDAYYNRDGQGPASEAIESQHRSGVCFRRKMEGHLLQVYEWTSQR